MSEKMELGSKAYEAPEGLDSAMGDLRLVPLQQSGADRAEQSPAIWDPAAFRVSLNEFLPQLVQIRQQRKMGSITGLQADERTKMVLDQARARYREQHS